MTLWNRVRTELEEAGRLAQGALDEGRLRLEAYRERKRADRIAQQLGWVYYRANVAQTTADAVEVTRLTDEMARHENEARRLEEQIAGIERSRTPGDAPPV